MQLTSYYAQNYVGIIGASLDTTYYILLYVTLIYHIYICDVMYAQYAYGHNHVVIRAIHDDI